MISLAVATLLAGSCGRSAQIGRSSTSAALERAQLIARADTICAHVNAKRAKITIVSSMPGYARFMPPFGAYAKSQYSQLKALKPPTSMAADWRAIIAGALKYAVNIIKSGEYAKAGNIRESHAFFEKAEAGVEQVNVIAASDGFADCAHTG